MQTSASEFFRLLLAADGKRVSTTLKASCFGSNQLACFVSKHLKGCLPRLVLVFRITCP